MTCIVQHVYLFLLLFSFGHLVNTALGANGPTFTNCGGVFTEPRGVISTPSFPGPYPTPISCEWLIHAPHGQKIVIYFTQFYMKDSFYITEYEYYQDKTTYIGRNSLGRISWTHALTSLAAYKPYVLIEFEVEAIGNRHLRVIDHLLEVHGFNITYEILDKSADLNQPTCSVSECSYLGNCLVTADFRNYKCHCFDKFFGENCQYGPYCDPDNGINQCTNGGRCEYFFGSLINQCVCPPGFAGSYCEISEIPESTHEHSEACLALNCKHLCDVDMDGTAYCMCYDGYKMHEDNGTCIPIDLYRMDVSLALGPVESMKQDQLDQKLDEAGSLIVKIIQENGLTTVTKFEIKELRQTGSGAVLEFVFYCKVSEIKLTRPALQALIDSGQVGIFVIPTHLPSYIENPELKIAEVSNFNMNPAIRGELLTLVCAAKGSRDIRFEWYKDDFRVDTSLTLRNTWISTIPDTVHGMQLSVLNIDNVGPLDKGVFTCEVEDFGDKKRLGVDVTVDNYPRVELTPMSLSVVKGEMASIKCITPDPDVSFEKITYEWLKNGMKIDSKAMPEYAEDMNPAGVRLVIPAVLEDARYTCKVNNKAGSANVTAYVSVIPVNETHLICPHTFEGQIHWQNTSGGHFYIEKCPTEQGGYARRNCVCDTESGTCEWTQPNFAKCQSLDLIKVYDELQLLRSGYQQTTLQSVFDKLYLFTFPKKNVLIFSGDMDMVAHILKDVLAHLKNFPQLVQENQPLSSKRLIELMSGILQQSSTATPDEKSIILVGPCIVQTLATMFSGALDPMLYESPISTLNVGMRKDFVNLIASEERAIGRAQPQSTELIRYRRDSHLRQRKVEIVIVKSRHLAELLLYRHKANSGNKQFFSKIVSPVYSSSLSEGTSQTVSSSRVQLAFSHDVPVSVGSEEKTVCLSWIYDPANMHSGRWTNTSCTLVASRMMSTVCNCQLPGHFVVGVIAINVTEPESFSTYDRSIHVPLLVGYSLSLLLLIVTSVIFIKAFGQVVGNIYCVHFSFILSVIAATVASMVCLFNVSSGQALQRTIQLILAFFYMSAQTHVVVEVFTVLIKVYSIDTLKLTKLRLLLICWGIPAVILIPIVVVLKTVEHSVTCNLICWFSTDMKHFYIYIMSTLFFILIFIVFICSSLFSLRKWVEEWRYSDRVRNIKDIGKSSIIFLFLILSTTSSLNLKYSSQSVQIAFHLVFHMCLCTSVLVFRCIFDKQIRFMFVRMCVKWERNPDSNSVKSSSAFRAFMKPEKVSNVQLSQEEYNVSRYYDEVNRTKYTVERKRHLSLLLGSSAGGESGYASVHGKSASAGNSNSSSKESSLSPMSTLTDDKTSDNGGNDSGIYDFQEASNYPQENEIVEAWNQSRHSGARFKYGGPHGRRSPNKVTLLDNGSSACHGERNKGLTPVYYQCPDGQMKDEDAGSRPRHTRRTDSPTRAQIAGNHQKHSTESHNDLDQVIYYPRYDKQSKLKSSVPNGSGAKVKQHPEVQVRPNEVAALIHAKPHTGENNDDLESASTSFLTTA